LENVNVICSFWRQKELKSAGAAMRFSANYYSRFFSWLRAAPDPSAFFGLFKKKSHTVKR